MRIRNLFNRGSGMEKFVSRIREQTSRIRNAAKIRFSQVIVDKMAIVSAAVPRAAAGAADVRLPRHTEGAGVHTPRPTEAHHPGLCPFSRPICQCYGSGSGRIRNLVSRIRIRI
jgi:hypothetical protein